MFLCLLTLVEKSQTTYIRSFDFYHHRNWTLRIYVWLVITKHFRRSKVQVACDFDWHITQILATSCFLSLSPSKRIYSLPGGWSLISCQVIVRCFYCAPCCCAAGYVVSSQSQTEVTDHLSIHRSPAAERDHLVLTKRSQLSILRKTQYQISWQKDLWGIEDERITWESVCGLTNKNNSQWYVCLPSIERWLDLTLNYLVALCVCHFVQCMWF